VGLCGFTVFGFVCWVVFCFSCVTLNVTFPGFFVELCLSVV